MKHIQKILEENKGMSSELGQRTGESSVTTYQRLKSWKNGTLRAKTKTLLLPAINQYLGAEYTIYDLDKDVPNKA